VITDASPGGQSADPFADLDAFVGLPRIGGLWLSPDGRRLVVGVGTLNHERTRFTTSLWEIDPAGLRPARRLTRGDRGESEAAFTPAGDLLFVSARPLPDDTGTAPASAASTALWLQPSGGGDARLVARPPGGVRGVVVSESGAIVFGSPMMPSSTDDDSEARIRARREKSGISAILHEEYPIRYWDHDVGPQRTRLLVAAITDESAVPDGPLATRDITGHVGRALTDESTWDITPDGGTVVAVWAVAEPGGSQRYTLVAIDVATGRRRTLADEIDHEYEWPRVSPDGTRVAVVVRRRPTPHDPGDRWLGIVALAGGPVRALAASWDRWPHAPAWTPDGTALVVTADEHGRSPLWLIDATTGSTTRLTSDNGAYTDVRIAPDGRWAYAVRSAIDSPPAPVRVALHGDPSVRTLPGPAGALGLDIRMPGRLEEVSASAADGTPLRAWLAVPEHAASGAPVPLLLQIHGGPVMSWNTWTWRWNPWIAVANGYAVLLPDPALSTGYGVDFIRRGWGAWGGTPYTDLMSITDAAARRADIDADRTAAMGGSFGGYMANWIAGQTDRFAAIITHASVWTLDHSIGTGDISYEFGREMTRETAEANSPHRFADAITTPMLVLHGDKDYRVPIGEGLRLWWDLVSRSKAEDGSSPHKFLYFPDENHWILTPNHAKLWYSTVLAFLDHHVRGNPWRRPDLLG